ncbi:MAG TPA: hypothetical protein VLD67_14010 [Vicinamibacterales bacterium]|nr:hypothetical protein [Vicinamibacterales bacterium]
MTSCDEAVRALVRAADSLEPSLPAELEAHLSTCASCRETLEDQRIVSQVLRARPADTVSSLFPVRLAARLDETAGWFDLADWRAWTFRLAPIAAVLALVALLTSDTAASSLTLQEWTMSGADSSAELLWQPDASTESVLESMFPGEAAATGEDGNVR